MSAAPQTLISHLAALVSARLNCIRSGNAEWKVKHEHAIDLLVRECPSGSGIDRGTSIDLEKSTSDRIVLACGFHHMDQHGFYAGWTEHTITIRPAFSGIDVTIGGRNRNEIKQYLSETYEYALTRPYVQGYDVDRKLATFERAQVPA